MVATGKSLHKPIALDGEAATTPALCYMLSHFPRSRKEEPILTWEDRRRLDGWRCYIPNLGGNRLLLIMEQHPNKNLLGKAEFLISMLSTLHVGRCVAGTHVRSIVLMRCVRATAPPVRDHLYLSKECANQYALSLLPEMCVLTSSFSPSFSTSTLYNAIRHI